MRMLCVILVSLLVSVVLGDQTYYQNSVAAFLSYSNLNLAPVKLPVAYVEVLLSSDQYAGTTSPLYATFVGTFSSSGPHLIGTLIQPKTKYTPSIQLQREIGELVNIWFDINGTDSLLISTLNVRMDSNVYLLDMPQQWLEKWDPVQAASDSKGDGFSPEAVISLPSSPTLLATVTSSYRHYTTTGLHEER
ncbi:hypothetical protein EON65_29320 [archaeon]|nr:MAG: hypothetical protein EON65_29320 [archaeon]